jgi:hypothetical protein
VLVYSDHDTAAAKGYDFNGWDAAKQVFYYTARARGQNPWPRRHIAVREAKPSLPCI